MSKVSPFLWFEKEAVEAARFYVSLLPDSRLNGVTALPADTPSVPEGSVQVVDFTLAGQAYVAMNAGRLDPVRSGPRSGQNGPVDHFERRTPRAQSERHSSEFWFPTHPRSARIGQAFLGSLRSPRKAKPPRRGQTRHFGDDEDGQARHRRPAKGF
ncbi:MAG TPA: VOC family protein [Rhizomicrobium sp.]|nr:VOC family protein [Rhizomicrobium sp.]